MITELGRTEIKICGLTNDADAAAALKLGADYLGFVLYAGSPRGISAGKLALILDKLDSNARAIGVFVNRPRNEVEKIAVDCGLYAVQIHGDEDPRDFADMPLFLWRAVRLDHGKCTPRPESWPVQRYVIDATVPGQYGGTGVPADWAEASKLARRHPVMLAGGLTPANVADAVRIVKPVGVDVASGVEAAPGRKDHTKLAAFVCNARENER